MLHLYIKHIFFFFQSNTAEEEKSDDETELPQLLVDEENEESDVDEELELELANLQKEGQA